MRWLVSLLLVLPLSASAFVRTTTKSSNPPCPGEQGKPLFWNVVTIPYLIDRAGSDDLAGDAQFQAIRQSFKTWEDVSCSYISFNDKGLVANAPVGFSNSGPNSNVVKWIEDTWTQSSRAIAVTLTTFDCNTGQIFDADILLNGVNFHFTTDPASVPGMDVQNTVTHEAGHFIGFDHDPSPNSTMYADAPPNETKKRNLSETDIAGVCEVYQVGHEPRPSGCSAGAGGERAWAVLGAAALALGARRRRRRPLRP
jgi:MYXO-CTERM domain-containing protein